MLIVLHIYHLLLHLLGYFLQFFYAFVFFLKLLLDYLQLIIIFASSFAFCCFPSAKGHFQGLIDLNQLRYSLLDLHAFEIEYFSFAEQLILLLTPNALPLRNLLSQLSDLFLQLENFIFRVLIN
jgi:hypothetical protein